jgi:pyrroline-5-carboxylate reductase
MIGQKRIAILGLGTMGRALAERLLGSASVSREQVRATVRHATKAEALERELDFAVGTDNAEAARHCEIILLCTKPKSSKNLVKQLAEAGALSQSPLLVTICAGISTAALEQASGGIGLRVVRAMPNTPCLIGEGMTVLSAGSSATDADLDVAEAIFRPLGRVLRLDEEHMDSVTGLSGSGPAFVYLIIEALAEGGVMTGLPRKVATELAAQTVQGAARMVLATGKHPAALKDDVTTPAGCTVSALLALEDGRLRSVLARGVQEAARAAAGLGGN